MQQNDPTFVLAQKMDQENNALRLRSVKREKCSQRE